MTTIEKAELTCPNCGTIFETRVLMSTNCLRTGTDFARYSGGAQPYRFTVHSCPGCGFSGPEDWFDESLSEEVGSRIGRHLVPLADDERPWRKFEYAARIAQWQSRPPEEVGIFYLRAAYLCAYHGDPDDERLNRSRAIEFLVQALENGNIPDASVPSLTYLIGELYRRIGLAEEARAWLEKAEALASAKDGLGWLAKLARLQRTNPQELMPPDL